MSSVAEVLSFRPAGVTKEVARSMSRDTLIEGARSADWWAQQSAGVQNKFMRTVRQGIENGESASRTAARITGGVIDGERIKGFMDVSRREARTLVRQSVAEVATEARMKAFKANADVIHGVQQLSTFDDRTTEICMAYSGAAWDLDGNPLEGTNLPFDGGPPRHWNCRSVLIPIVKSFEDLGLEGPSITPGTRASLNGQVAADMSFDKWLKGQSRVIQERLLGKQKTALFRSGQLQLKNLLDVSTRPIAAAELSVQAMRGGYRGRTPGSKKETANEYFDKHWWAAREKSAVEQKIARQQILDYMQKDLGLQKSTSTNWFREFDKMGKPGAIVPPAVPPVVPPKPVPPATPPTTPQVPDVGAYTGHRAGSKMWFIRQARVAVWRQRLTLITSRQ